MPTALNALRQTEGGFLGPRHNMRRSPRDGTQARGAGVFLDRAGQTANLIVASVRALLRARHGSEAVHLQWTRFTPTAVSCFVYLSRNHSATAEHTAHVQLLVDLDNVSLLSGRERAHGVVA